jgi:hypothetical protein
LIRCTSVNINSLIFESSKYCILITNCPNSNLKHLSFNNCH